MAELEYCVFSFGLQQRTSKPTSLLGPLQVNVFFPQSKLNVLKLGSLQVDTEKSPFKDFKQ